MPSSTSHSDRQVPLLALLLLGLGAVVLGLEVLYTVRWNPEIRFFCEAYQIKTHQARRLEQGAGPKTVISGGSSSLFSIDTGRLQSVSGIPSVNMAFAAGMGASVLTQAALQELRPGDTLVVALEPTLLTDSLEPPAMGVQFGWATGNTAWFFHPQVGGQTLSWPSALLALRPGGYHIVTMIGKWVRGGPIYRYRIEDMHPDGFTQTEVRVPDPQPGWHVGRLSPESHLFLKSLAQWCREHQVQVYYLLPWSYGPPEVIESFRRLNAQFLVEISQYIPTLRDPRLGAYEDKAHFADSGFHLTPEGAVVRTDVLAELLKNRRVWSPDELRVLAQVRP